MSVKPVICMWIKIRLKSRKLTCFPDISPSVCLKGRLAFIVESVYTWWLIISAVSASCMFQGLDSTLKGVFAPCVHLPFMWFTVELSCIDLHDFPSLATPPLQCSDFL